MNTLTDIELIRKCAEKMGYMFFIDAYGYPCVDVDGNEDNEFEYNPLTDDAQAMGLVKRFNLCIGKFNDKDDWVCEGDNSCAQNPNLNRAICECVAKLP